MFRRNLPFSDHFSNVARVVPNKIQVGNYPPVTIKKISRRSLVLFSQAIYNNMVALFAQKKNMVAL
jgi:hypothetical protein